METFVGSCNLQVIDEPKSLSIPTWVMYPTHVPSVPVAFGPYSINVSLDAPVDQSQFPLIVISHGSGGSPLVYRTIGAFLVKCGFIVALPEHPGLDTEGSSGAFHHGSGRRAGFEQRPR